MLNHPLPYDLHIELQQLKIMEHNTLIRYGFEKGIEQTVFDPETESHLAGVVASEAVEAPRGVWRCL